MIKTSNTFCTCIRVIIRILLIQQIGKGEVGVGNVFAVDELNPYITCNEWIEIPSSFEKSYRQIEW